MGEEIWKQTGGRVDAFVQAIGTAASLAPSRIGYRPPMWDPELPDEIVPIATVDAEQMARRLAREEGLFAGTSSGANVLAAIQVGQRLGPDARVATLLVDSGLKYLSTPVFRR